MLAITPACCNTKNLLLWPGEKNIDETRIMQRCLDQEYRQITMSIGFNGC
jgi:hypothetical protein